VVRAIEIRIALPKADCLRRGIAGGQRFSMLPDIAQGNMVLEVLFNSRKLLSSTVTGGLDFPARHELSKQVIEG
jgi:hypothetical protein